MGDLCFKQINLNRIILVQGSLKTAKICNTKGHLMNLIWSHLAYLKNKHDPETRARVGKRKVKTLHLRIAHLTLEQLKSLKFGGEVSGRTPIYMIFQKRPQYGISLNPWSCRSNTLKQTRA